MAALQSILSVLAGILQVTAFGPYVLAIIRRQTVPAKASWVIWAFLDTLTLCGMVAEDALNGLIVGAVIGVWIVVILTMKYGKPGWTNLDRFCLSGAAVGLLLWWVFDSPVLAIITSQVVVFVGAIPTFESTWRDPSKEDRTAWTLFWLACICALLAIPAWTLEDAAQPINFFIIESAMMYLLFVRPWHRKSLGQQT